jgi:MFS family permease
MAAVPSRLLPTYYAFQAASTSVFSTSIFVVYYQQHFGLTLAVVLALQSYNTGVRALLELPCGRLADRWSRRGCLVASGAALLAGTVLLVAWPTLASAVLAETLLAAATALRSGADTALLFDGLHGEGRAALYPRAESRAQAIASIGSGLAAILGGLLASVDLRLPYVATALAAFGTMGVATALPESRPLDAGGPGATLVEAARVAARSGAVRWSIALAVFAVVLSHVYYYLQQPYLETIGVPVAAFGVVFAATKGLTAAIATQAHRIDAALGPRGAAALMAATAAAGLGGMAVATGPAGAALIGTRGLLDGLWMPLINIHLNRVVDSRLRATLLSLRNLIARLALSATLAVLGVASGWLPLGATLGLIALAAVGGGVVLVVWRPHPGATPHSAT